MVKSIIYIAKVIKLWLIVSYLLFAQQEYNRKWQKHGGHVVYVIEQSQQTGQFQKFVETLERKYEFLKKSKNVI